MDEAERERLFELHHEAQRRAFLKLTPRERLEWLEEAKRFAAVAIAAAEQRARSEATAEVAESATKNGGLTRPPERGQNEVGAVTTRPKTGR